MEGSTSSRLNERDSQGNTLLAWAVILNKPDHVVVLLRRGADTTLADGAGQTPLHKACIRSDESRRAMVLTLLQAGADCNAADADGVTPLMLACMHDEVVTVNAMLAQYRGDVTVNDFQGMTCTSHAACHHAYTVLHALITSPSVTTVDSADYHGRQPLHWACLLGDVQLLTMVMELQPAKLTLCTRTGENALHLAAKEGNEACMNMLLAQAHPNQRLLLLLHKTNQGLTPSELCRQQGYPMLAANLIHLLADCQMRWQLEHGATPFNEEAHDKLDINEDTQDNLHTYPASAEDSDSSSGHDKRKLVAKVARAEGGKTRGSQPSRAAYMRSRREKVKVGWELCTYLECPVTVSLILLLVQQTNGRKQSNIQQLADREEILLAALQELRQDRAALQQASARRSSAVDDEDPGISSL